MRQLPPTPHAVPALPGPVIKPAMSFADVYARFFAEVTDFFADVQCDEIYVWSDGFICDDYEFEDSIEGRDHDFTTIHRSDWNALFPF